MLASSLAWFLVPGEICIWWRGDDRVTVQCSHCYLPLHSFPPNPHRRWEPAPAARSNDRWRCGHRPWPPPTLPHLSPVSPIQHYHHFSNTEYSSVHCSEEEFTWSVFQGHSLIRTVKEPSRSLTVPGEGPYPTGVLLKALTNFIECIKCSK